MRFDRTSVRVILVTLSLLNVSLGLLCWRQAVELERWQSAVAMTEREQRESQRARQTLDAALSFLANTTRQLADARAKYGLLRSPAPKLPPRPPSAKENLNLAPAHLLFLSKIQRMVVQENYGLLLSYLKLPATKLEKLKHLLADRNQAMVDARQIVRESGDPDWLKISEQVQRPLIDQFDEEIRGLLGEDHYRSYLGYEALLRTEPLFLRDLELEMNDARLAITPEQQILLARVIEETKGMAGKGPDPAAEVAIVRLSSRHELILARAAAIFPPAQLQQLEAYLAETTRETELIQRLGFPEQ